jgi:DNA-binding beta-propeller fold protein YncE
MRTRSTWIVAILVLVLIGVLLACSTKYSSSYNGLVVVPSQGSVVVQSFSLDLSNGHIAQINNVNGPPINGLPTAVVLDPAGAFAYMIVSQNSAVPGSVTSIGTFPISSDGKLAAGTTTPFNPISATVTGPCSTSPPSVAVQAPAMPGSNLSVVLAIDSAGKYLFVADGATSAEAAYTCNGAPMSATVPVPGAVSVFAVSNGVLTEVPGSPFVLPSQLGGQTPSASALAVTPTIYPAQYAYCSGFANPTTEDLYVTDSVNYVVLNYSVDPSSGTLTLVPTVTTTGVATGSVPSGVAVDPCNRFAYVANAGVDNTVSAYTICSIVSLANNCSTADYSLQPIQGSPYAVGDTPGPIMVNPFANFLYVVDTGSSEISEFRISPTTGTLGQLSPTTVATGLGANSIAMRSDDSWAFVANITSNTVSEYAITPATGVLSPQAPITTYNYPSGVAVK